MLLKTSSACVTLGVAVAVGLMFGPLDLAGQVNAPYPFANLFNSPVLWAAGAFVIGMWASEPKRAAQAGCGTRVEPSVLVSMMHVTGVAVGVGECIVVMGMAVGRRGVHAGEMVVLMVFVVLVAVVVIE